MLFRLVILLSIYLPFQLALNPTEGIDLASIRIFILIIFFFWLAQSLKNKNLEVKDNFVTYLILTFLFLNLFSSFFAPHPEWSVRKLLFLFSIFPVYFVFSAVIDTKKKRKGILRALAASGIMASLVGIFQFLIQFIIGIDALQSFWARYFAVPFLGKNVSQTVMEYPSWLVNVSGNTYFRAIGFFPDPHMFSFFLGLLFPLAIGLFLTEKKKGWLLGAGIILLADILTFSRGAYLGLGAGALFLFVIALLKMKNSHKLTAIIGMIAICLVLIIPNPVSSRFFSSFNLREGSNMGRIEMWEKACDSILENPLIGTGIGNFPLEVDPLAGYRKPIYAHNTYLDIAAETGIFSALAFLSVLFFAIKNFLGKSRGNILNLCLAFSLIIFSAHSLVDTGIYSPVVLTLLLIILALTPGQCEKAT